MGHNRLLGSMHVILLLIAARQAIPTPAAFVPCGEPTRVLPSPDLTVTAAFSTFSATQPLGPIMNVAVADNQGLSSSFQPFNSGTPTTSSVSASNDTATSTATDIIRKHPAAVPMIAGILAGMIVIVAIIVICFVKRRRKRRRRRRHSARTSLQPDSYPRQDSRNWFLRDEIPSENDLPQQKYHHHPRHSRYARGIMELDVRESAPQIAVTGDEIQSTTHESSDNQQQQHLGSGSTFSSTDMNKIDVNRPDHQVVDGSLSLSMLVSSNLGIVSSNQYSPQPVLGSSQPPSSSSRGELLHPLPLRGNSALPPEVGQRRLNALIQQRVTLLPSGNTSNTSEDNPPPYDHR